MSHTARAEVVLVFTIAVSLSLVPSRGWTNDTSGEAADSDVVRDTGHGMPVASIRSNYYGFADLVDPIEGTFEEELEASMLFTEVSGTFPIPFLDRKIVLLPRVFFEHTHFEYRGWDFDVTPANEQITDFYATGFEMGVINQLSESVWFVSRLSWGLYSDLKEIDENDARLYGILMFDVRVAEGTVIGLGLSYDSNFGFPTPLPFLHLAHRNPWFRGETYIPSYAEFFLLLHERVEIGARGRLLGNEYRMTYDSAQGNDLLVQLSTLELGGVAALRVYQGLWMELGGGATLNNRYKAVLPDGNLLREIDFSPTWFANLALIYRL